MVTYLYWIVVVLLSVLLGWVAWRLFKVKAGLVVGVVVFLAGWAMYTFHYQQILVKNWGGVMSISVPEGQYHMQMTWKDDNLWVEHYNPEDNTCHFTEYPKGNLLAGEVVIKNCNPLHYAGSQRNMATAPIPAP